MTWPTFLPLPNNSFSIKHEKELVRSTMESGRIRQRIRFSGARETYSVQWTFSDSEFEFFRAWFEHTISGGLDWFDISLPVGGAGELKTVSARFIGQYSDSHLAVLNHRVSATLETESPIIQDSSWTDAILYWGNDLDQAIVDLDLFDNLINTQFPTL